MELKGTKTEKNLWEAFAGESQARNKYTFFASVAKKEGYEQLAAIFEETAANEKEHAKMWFKALNGGSIPDTMTCLEMAAGGEHDEWTEMYPRMAAEAKEEGFTQLAALFTMVAQIEKEHEERYRELAENLKNNKVFAREEQQVWQCRNCGYTYIGKSAPLKCPVCAHPQSYFELKKAQIIDPVRNAAAPTPGLRRSFCTKFSGKTGIVHEIRCESTALWAKNLTHIGRTCKMNQ